MNTPPPDTFPLGPLGRLLQRLQNGRRPRRGRLASLRQRVVQAIDKRLEGRSGAAPAALPAPPITPADLLRQLLANSEEQTREQAETLFFGTVLRSLTPDQARILSALSGGATYPLIHVLGGSRLVPGGMRPVLECVSNVGRAAGVSCPDLTPVYVQGLMAWGLAEIEAVEAPDSLKYELLETETLVRRAMEQLKQGGEGSRIVRRTLRLSPLGERLWTTCRFEQEES